MTDAAQKQQFLACLSDPSRFSLVTTLAGGPRCVTELATLVGLSQSCTTRHLQALLRVGLVTGERNGKRVVYALRVSDSDAHPVLRWACGPIDLSATSSSASAAGLSDNGLEGRPRRRTRERTGSPRVPTAVPETSVEVTDALIVAHDSAWPEASDSNAPFEDRETKPSPTQEAPRAVRAELDDFLL